MVEVRKTISLYVNVTCTGVCSHRDPSGLYIVEIIDENDPLTNAKAAAEVTELEVPFLDENIHGATIRVFSEDGCEVTAFSSHNAEYAALGFIKDQIFDIPKFLDLD